MNLQEIPEKKFNIYHFLWVNINLLVFGRNVTKSGYSGERFNIHIKTSTKKFLLYQKLLAEIVAKFDTKECNIFWNILLINFNFDLVYVQNYQFISFTIPILKKAQL